MLAAEVRKLRQAAASLSEKDETMAVISAPGLAVLGFRDGVEASR